ncbi:MAG: AI-2E family transporter [Oscillochloridaceae bacterium umkhey_bin13]
MEPESRRLPWDQIKPSLLVAGLQAWLYLGIVAGILTTLLMLSALAGLVVPLVIAMMLAMLFFPVVDWLATRRIPRQLGAIGVIVGLLAVITIALWLTLEGIFSQYDQILRLIDAGIVAAEQWAAQVSLPVGIFDGLLTNVLNVIPQVAAGIGSFFSASFSGAIALFFGLFLSSFLLYYLLTDWHGVVSWLAHHIGLEPAAGERIMATTTEAVRRYFYALTLSSIVVSVTIGSTMALLGLPLAVTIGLVTLITSYVPYLGAIVSGIFAFMIALGSGGVSAAITVLVIVLLMQNIIQTIIQNRLASQQLRLHPLVTFIATILGGIVLGVIGAMLATPATAAVIRGREDLRQVRKA